MEQIWMIASCKFSLALALGMSVLSVVAVKNLCSGHRQVSPGVQLYCPGYSWFILVKKQR
jgi:hypothetical protein